MHVRFLTTSVASAGVVAIALAASVGRGAPALAAAAPADSTRDSLLVADQVYQGWKWFHVYCFRCHGEDAVSGGLAPDLRVSLGPHGLVTHEVFMQTVANGRLDKGMPGWKVLLDSAQTEQLYAYVVARSSGQLVPGRPHRVTDLTH